MQFKTKTMKTSLLLTLFIVLSMGSDCAAGDYFLFNENSKKLFTNIPTRNQSYSLSFDSVSYSADAIFYHQFKKVGSTSFSVINCINYFWGSDYCFPQNKPSWLGAYVKKHDNLHYDFLTAAYQTLSFDFNIRQNNSTVFYSDANQYFSIYFEGTDTLTHLGITDSVRFYRISHTASNGVPINSVLNNFVIKVGKEMGLISFFIIDLFPSTLVPIELVGNNSPNAGIAHLTHEMVYDHQPGDINQWKRVEVYTGGSPDDNYTLYTRYTYLSRVNTADSLFYSVARYRFKANTNWIVYDTIQLGYRRNNSLAEIPFDKYLPDQIGKTRTFYRADYCGLSLWTYFTDRDLVKYCPEDNCWGALDCFPISFEIQSKIVAGLGQYYYYEDYDRPDPGGENHTTFTSLIYFKKNEVECGMLVEVPENHVVEKQCLKVYPNPVYDQLQLDLTETKFQKLMIVDINGTVVLELNHQDDNQKLDVSTLNSGVYILQIVSENKLSYSKFVKY